MKRKVKLVIENEGKLLLLNPINKNKLTLIGGGIEKWESPVQAAIREGFEEAGLMLSPSDFNTYCCVPTTSKDKPSLFYCYLLQKEGIVFELKEHHKFSTLEWVPVSLGLVRLKGIEKSSAQFFIQMLQSKNRQRGKLKRAI